MTMKISRIKHQFIGIFIFSIICISLFLCKREEVILHGDLTGVVTDASTSEPILVAGVKLSPSDDTTSSGLSKSGFDTQDNEEKEVFYLVDEMPSFEGGSINNFQKWVAKNLKYPEIAAENNISGRVYIMFVIEPDGKMGNVTISRGVDPALDAEAIRVVKSSPKWTPGKQRGKPVRVAYTIPIAFKLQSFFSSLFGVVLITIILLCFLIFRKNFLKVKEYGR